MADSKELAIYLDNAQESGEISAKTRRIMADPEVQKQIMLSSGTPSSQINSDGVEIVTVLVDDSGSMASHTNAVIRGQTRIIKILEGSPKPNIYLVSTQLLNGGLVDPYHPLAEAAKLDSKNYRPEGGTPLAKRVRQVFGVVNTKRIEATEEWKTARTVTLIMSDGQDNESSPADFGDVSTIVRDMRATRNHIIIAMGFGGNQSEFFAMFIRFGLDPKWILTTNSTDEDIYNALTKFGEAARQAAASEEQFQLLLEGGFDKVS